MTDYVCTIERLANGFEVELTDPKIVAQNNKRDGKLGSNSPIVPWKDPKIGYAFKNVDEVCAFLKTNLDKAMPLDEYGGSFDAAVAEGDDNE